MKKMIMLSALTGVLLLTGCGEETTYNDFNTTDEFNEDNPVITLLGDKTIEIPLGQRTVNEPGFTATDIQDGDITYAVNVTNNIDLNNPGTYTVTYDVMDSEGFKDVKTRTIVILDPNSSNNNDNNVTIYNGGETYKGSVPQITFPGGNPLYLRLGEEYDTEYIAQDFEDGDLGAHVNIEGSDFNINQTGTYTVTYSVTDSHGNTATERRTVFVGDYTTDNDTSTWSDATWNDTTPSDLDNFKAWYSDTCGNSFNDSLYNENTGYYAGTISCSNRGLDSIDLSTMSIFSSIQSIDFSHNNLDYIDLSPFNNTNVIEKVDLSHNNFSYIDFRPLYQLNNINELWINNNNLNYNRSQREEIYRGFNNKSFTIYF
ncbi:MAG TPA: DUF5011 domain-containing protein [Sulfurovum sp.]|nr:DUF5011 domain-containing protein [Sulfurovum sp.]